jgi:putative dehydrogenase
MTSFDPTIPSALGPPRVGIIGVGSIGGALVARLRTCGFSVVVNDIDPEAEARAVSLGAMACATPAGLAMSCDVVIVTVVDGPQTESVLFGDHGAAAAMAPGSLVMLCPTISPDDVVRFTTQLDTLGIDWMDAPTSGGPIRVRDGHMSLMLACSADVQARHRALLSVLSSRVMYVGDRAGDGARTKLVNNLLASINLAGTAEVLALAERLGLEMARTLQVIEQSSGQNWIGGERMDRVLRGDTLPRARTALLAKDSGLALDAARGAGFSVPLGGQAAALFARACAEGLLDQDDASLLTWMRARRP